MKNFEMEAQRAVEILRSLEVSVESGSIVWSPGAGGLGLRPTIVPAIAPVGGGPIISPWHVIQGSNLFTFGPDEEKLAREFAKELQNGLEKISKSQKRAVAKRMGELLA